MHNLNKTGDCQALRNIYINYGEAVILDSKRLKAYLLDMRVPKKTINLLVDISRLQLLRRIVKEGSVSGGTRERLIFDTENEYAFDAKAIRYAVDCWIYAVTGRLPDNADIEESSSVTESVTENRFNSDIWTDEDSKLAAAVLREMMLKK